MASLVLTGDTSGQVTLAAPAVAGTNTATLPVATGELSMLGGTGQTWQNVSASRASNTTYTNTSGKPIYVAVAMTSSASTQPIFAVAGGITFYGNSTTTAGTISSIEFIVPVGGTYLVNITSFSAISSWAELR